MMLFGLALPAPDRRARAQGGVLMAVRARRAAAAGLPHLAAHRLQPADGARARRRSRSWSCSSWSIRPPGSSSPRSRRRRRCSPASSAISTLHNYVDAVRRPASPATSSTACICASRAVLISTFVSVLAAYAFSRMRFRGKRYIFGSVLLGQCFPWIILVTPLFILFAQLGLLNNHLGDAVRLHRDHASRSRSICWSAIWNRCRASSTRRRSSTAARASR